MAAWGRGVPRTGCKATGVTKQTEDVTKGCCALSRFPIRKVRNKSKGGPDAACSTLEALQRTQGLNRVAQERETVKPWHLWERRDMAEKNSGIEIFHNAVGTYQNRTPWLKFDEIGQNSPMQTLNNEIGGTMGLPSKACEDDSHIFWAHSRFEEAYIPKSVLLDLVRGVWKGSGRICKVRFRVVLDIQRIQQRRWKCRGEICSDKEAQWAPTNVKTSRIALLPVRQERNKANVQWTIDSPTNQGHSRRVCEGKGQRSLDKRLVSTGSEWKNHMDSRGWVERRLKTNKTIRKTGGKRFLEEVRSRGLTSTKHVLLSKGTEWYYWLAEREDKGNSRGAEWRGTKKPSGWKVTCMQCRLKRRQAHAQCAEPQESGVREKAAVTVEGRTINVYVVVNTKYGAKWIGRKMNGEFEEETEEDEGQGDGTIRLYLRSKQWMNRVPIITQIVWYSWRVYCYTTTAAGWMDRSMTSWGIQQQWYRERYNVNRTDCDRRPHGVRPKTGLLK